MIRAWAMSALLLVACDRDVELFASIDAAAERDGGDLGIDGSMPAALSCSGLGTSIQLPATASSQCASALSAAAHRFAICSCATVELGQMLTSDAFDSTGATGAGSMGAAALGINGNLSAMSQLVLEGALYVAGDAGATFGDVLQTAASLRVQGASRFMGSSATMGTDAYVGGDLSGDATIVGSLHVPMSASVANGISAAAIVREPVTIAPPCDCSTSFVDLERAIGAAEQTNDDAAIGLDRARLKGAGAPAVLDLPCGIFAVDGIDLESGMTLNVHGRAELVVSGEVKLRKGLSIVLDTGAELDLIIGGALTSAGGHTVGNTAAPARFRIWTPTTQPLMLDGGPIVGATIYAPRASVSSPLGLELFGSLLASSFESDGPVVVHYDRATLVGGVVCGAAAQTSIR